MRERYNKLGQRGFAAAGIVYMIFSAIIVLLVVRLLFSLLGANPGNAIAHFVYTTSAPLVAPFFGLFTRQPQLGIAGFEFETLVAIIVYGLIAAIFSRLVSSHH